MCVCMYVCMCVCKLYLHIKADMKNKSNEFKNI